MLPLLPIAIEFTDTITLGAAILSVIGALAVIVGTIYGTKYKVGYEAASAAAQELRNALTDERDRVSRMEQQITDGADQLRQANATIARLESLPDFAQIVKLLDAHEVRAQDRHEQTTSVLTALTDRILEGGTA